MAGKCRAPLNRAAIHAAFRSCVYTNLNRFTTVLDASGLKQPNKLGLGLGSCDRKRFGRNVVTAEACPIGLDLKFNLIGGAWF